MKRYITYILCAASVAFTACNKAYQVTDPVFEVSAPSAAKVGQSVQFTLDGSVDMITFYSGEDGSSYEYKDKDRYGSGTMEFSFMTTTSNAGTVGHPNPAVLPISYSTDFSGEYSREEMEKATWIDLTGNFQYPEDINVSSIPSGTMDISKLFPEDGGPIYFRYFYKVDAWDASSNGGLGNGRTQWTVMNCNVTCNLGSSSATVYDILGLKWQIIPGNGYETIPEANLPSLPGTSARILFRSQFKPTVDLEMWTISCPIYRSENVNLGRDKGIGIKSVADATMSSYPYVYTKPGEYTATFVGINANINGHKEVSRSVKINIIQDSGDISGPEYEEWK